MFDNHLPEPTSIHWHGFEIFHNMDGGPGISQDPVKPGGRFFIYEFTLHQEGTYFYHSHMAMQEMLGILGAFIMHPKTPFEPRVDKDFVILLQEYAVLPKHGFDTMNVEFNWLVFNGKAASMWPPNANSVPGFRQDAYMLGMQMPAQPGYTGASAGHFKPLNVQARTIMTQHLGAVDEENEYFYAWLKLLHTLPERQQQIVRADRAHDIKTVAELLSLRKFYIQKYAHAIPTNAALKTIAELAPIIEIGAGTGYWASLLRQQAVDILCYDQNPPGLPSTLNRYHEGATCWTEVLSGDDSAIDLHPQRTLLLCWPPPHDDMPFRALQRYQGEYFIYIGELPADENGCLYLMEAGKPIRKGVMITHHFVAELHSYWELLRCVELPHWEICWDNLYVFKRRSDPQGKEGLNAAKQV